MDPYRTPLETPKRELKPASLFHRLMHKWTIRGTWNFSTRAESNGPFTRTVACTCRDCGFRIRVTWERSTKKIIKIERDVQS